LANRSVAGAENILQPSRPAVRRIRLDCADYLFAAFVGLAVATVLSPIRTVYLPTHLIRLLPLVTYQDLGLVIALAWLFHGLLSLVTRPAARGAVAFVGLTLCLLLALFSYLSVVIFAIVRRPLSYGLLVAGSDLSGIRASIVAVATPTTIVSLAFAPWLMVTIAVALSRVAPGALRRMRNGFHSAAGIVLAIAFLVSARAWSARNLSAVPVAFTNPEWTLASSFFDRSSSLVTDKIPAAYLDDFRPVGERRARSALRVPGGLNHVAQHRPLNVLMIVMESVGAHRFALHPSTFDSPQMIELSRHAAIFEHAYSAQPSTSCAMAALFSSVYPDHDWPSLTRLAPELAIAGMPAVLARHGYRTAFIHSGQLTYDRESMFLQTRGFNQIIAEQQDYDAPRDQVLLPETMKWIKAEPSKPFFVALWTQDTHHPYLSTLHHDYGASTPQLNQYLNAVDSTANLIGQLAKALQTMGLADRTLLVITGDHGEAFGEHGVLAHGGNVYDEETRVPLLIVNPTLFPHKLVVNRVAQQIDIAPTLLGLLGYDLPPHWQGIDLFASDQPRRAYLFSGEGTASFGLVEGKFKYIYRVQGDREELYDLTKDPYEKNDLSRDPAYAAVMRRDHLRVEAWVSFQNPYLARFENPAARAGR
jgi:arylsulfatase A-like enzyme